jgi:hypothetical protein
MVSKEAIGASVSLWTLRTSEADVLYGRESEGDTWREVFVIADPNDKTVTISARALAWSPRRVVMAAFHAGIMEGEARERARAMAREGAREGATGTETEAGATGETGETGETGNPDTTDPSGA